jgi:hypothetical protein
VNTAVRERFVAIRCVISLRRTRIDAAGLFRETIANRAKYLSRYKVDYWSRSPRQGSLPGSLGTAVDVPGSGADERSRRRIGLSCRRASLRA